MVNLSMNTWEAGTTTQPGLGATGYTYFRNTIPTNFMPVRNMSQPLTYYHNGSVYVGNHSKRYYLSVSTTWFGQLLRWSEFSNLRILC